MAHIRHLSSIISTCARVLYYPFNRKPCFFVFVVTYFLNCLHWKSVPSPITCWDDFSLFRVQVDRKLGKEVRTRGKLGCTAHCRNCVVGPARVTYIRIYRVIEKVSLASADFHCVGASGVYPKWSPHTLFGLGIGTNK